MARRIIIGLVGAAAVAAALIVLLRPGEHAEPAEPYNLLLITLDTTRADRLGCYGYEPALTPALDGLAKGGVRFEQTLASAPLTLPSHATMLTGLQPPEHGLRVNGANRLGAKVPTLAGLLKAQGYDTAAFIAAFALDSHFGLDRGFDIYDDDQTGAHTDYHGDHLSSYRPGNLVTDRALAWLNEHADRPFFCWVHLYDPHLPYHKHEELAGTPFEDQASYDAEVAFMDMQVERLLAFLEQQGLTDRTLVIAVGDHGEGLGEHGEQGHGYFIYETTQHVPMVFAAPGLVPAGEQVATMVSLVDLFPTILDLLDVQPPGAGMGRSLKPALEGARIDWLAAYAETDMPYTAYGWCPLRSIRTPAWKYIHTVKPELYNLEDDPGELHNVVDERPEVARDLRTRLQDIESQMVAFEAEDVDASPGKLEELGYVAPRHSADDTSELDISELRDMKDMLPVAEDALRMRDLLRADKKERALQMCRRLVVQDPESERLQHYLADALLANDRLDEARDTLENLLATYETGEEDLVVVNKLGKTLLDLNKVDESVRYLEMARDRQPDFLAARNNLGTAYLRMGKLPEAVSEFEAAVRIENENAIAHTNLGEALLRQGKLDKALEHCTRAAALAPDNHRVHQNLAMVKVEQQDIAGALRHFRRAADLAPDDDTVQADLGLALARAGHLDDAIRHLGQAVQLNPAHVEARYNLGIALMHKRRVEAAVEQFRAVIRLDRDHVDARVNLSNGLLSLGQWEEAASQCRAVVERQPDNLAAHFNLGLACLELGKHEQAVAHFEEVLRIDPGNQQGEAQLARAEAQLGTATAPAR